MALAIERSELKSAFDTFTEVSTALEASYRDLEREVARLHGELARARRERVRHDAERERLATRHHELLAALPGGVLELDAYGLVRAANPAAEELLGVAPEGRAWADLSEGAGDLAVGRETVLPSGRRVGVARRDLAGGGAIVLLTDVTEATLVRDLLARHQRLSTLGEMAARLAHDVRTPLAAALLYASRLSSDGLAGDDRREIAGKVVGRLRHLEGLVADMLAFARGAGATLVRCDVGALLEGVAQSLVPRLTERARLTIRTHAPGLAVRGNPDALVGAILNLANNALDAAGATALVEIEARERGGCAEIRVRDNGPGVPTGLRDRIFEPFYTTRTGGTGLGLAVVRTVALAHGGAIELEEGGLGACFCLRLARHEDAA
jgi:two-component system sensor histidine kinase FlrB